MDGGVAAGGPAGAAINELGVVNFADEELARLIGRAVHLDVALETEIVVALGEELPVDGAVGVMAGGAAFAHGFVFVDEGTGLLAMTFGALLIDAGHGEAAGRFHDFVAVRIVALDTIHAAFDDRMMLRKVEQRVDVKMALETGGRVFTGIDDEFLSATAELHVFAGGTVAGFAAGDVGEFDVVLVKLAVSAGGEEAGDVGVTFDAGGVADVMCTFDMRRCDDGARDGAAGDEEGGGESERSEEQERSLRRGNAC